MFYLDLFAALNLASQSQRDQRTYFVSDERLRAFAQLTPLQRLQWVEQCSHFVRLGQMAQQAEPAQATDR
jgi:hypothetical protein